MVFWHHDLPDEQWDDDYESPHYNLLPPEQPKAPLRCRLGWHHWSIWTVPANYRHCFRCKKVERR
jgi:hypothetical protein